MTDDGKDEDGGAEAMLTVLFSEARATRPGPNAALLERIAADALAAQPHAAAVSGPQRAAGSVQGRLLRVGQAALARWEALAWPAGVAATVLAGVWLGGWADVNGFVSGAGFAQSGLALTLAQGVPGAAGWIGGY
jgi:hypothetical protein